MAARGELIFSTPLSSDPATKYWLYYARAFNTTGATLVQDSGATNITGYLSGRTSISVELDSLLETGYTAVAIGLNRGQYIINRGQFNSGTTVINLSAPMELNYQALTGINWVEIYNTPTTRDGYGLRDVYTTGETLVIFSLTSHTHTQFYTTGVTYTKTEVDSLLSAQTNSVIYEDINSTQTLESFDGQNSDGGEWLYTVKDGPNSKTGNILAVWDLATSASTDTNLSTVALGVTTGISFDISLSGNTVNLIAVVSSGNWKISLKRFTHMATTQSISVDIDGGSASSVYLITQKINGGGA